MNTLENDFRLSTPARFMKGRQVGVIGNHKNFINGGVYGHVAKHCGLDVRVSNEVDSAPVGFVVWMNGVLGDSWGWNHDTIKRQVDEVRSKWPEVKIIGDPSFKDDKLVVERAFSSVFNYDLAIDPKAYFGKAVRKSRIQARHDGEVLSCPIDDPDPMSCYELLIDNTIGGEYVKDVRVPIIGGVIPFCYLKYRPISTRFTNVNSKVFVSAVRDVLSRDEEERILRFAAELKLEIGELDILRNAADGRIFIVDANNTPSGPPNGLSSEQSGVAVRLLASAFMDTFT